MHDGMPYGLNQGQGQGHSREVDRQSPTGLIFFQTQYVPVGAKSNSVKLRDIFSATNWNFSLKFYP